MVNQQNNPLVSQTPTKNPPLANTMLVWFKAVLVGEDSEALLFLLSSP
jgi:hypothetical protein